MFLTLTDLFWSIEDFISLYSEEERTQQKWCEYVKRLEDILQGTLFTEHVVTV